MAIISFYCQLGWAVCWLVQNMTFKNLAVKVFDLLGVIISNPEIGQGENALFFEPLKVEGALKDAIETHPLVNL